MEHLESTPEQQPEPVEEGVEGPPPERFDEDPARNPDDENLKGIKGG